LRFSHGAVDPDRRPGLVRGRAAWEQGTQTGGNFRDKMDSLTSPAGSDFGQAGFNVGSSLFSSILQQNFEFSKFQSREKSALGRLRKIRRQAS
jgi:hypothetical protein